MTVHYTHGVSETNAFASTSEQALSMAASFQGSLAGTELETQVGASWSPEQSFLSRETVTEKLEHSDKFELTVGAGKYVQVKQPIISFSNPSSDESLFVSPRFYKTHEDVIGENNVCPSQKDRTFQEGAVYTIKNRQFQQHYMRWDPDSGTFNQRIGAGRTWFELPDLAYWKFEFATHEDGESYWFIVSESKYENTHHRLTSGHSFNSDQVQTERDNAAISERQMYRMKLVNPDVPSDEPKYFQIINKHTKRAVMKYKEGDWNLYDMSLGEADERSHWHVESILGNGAFDWDEFYSYDNLADQETTVSVEIKYGATFSSTRTNRVTLSASAGAAVALRPIGSVEADASLEASVTQTIDWVTADSSYGSQSSKFEVTVPPLTKVRFKQPVLSLLNKREDDIFFVRPQRFERVDCAINMTDPEYSCISTENEPVDDEPESDNQVLVHGAQYIIRNALYDERMMIAIDNEDIGSTTDDVKNLKNAHIWTVYNDPETDTWFIVSQKEGTHNSRLYGNPNGNNPSGRTRHDWDLNKDQQWYLFPTPHITGKTRFTIRNFEYTSWVYRIISASRGYRTIIDKNGFDESSQWYFEPAYEIEEEPEWEEIFFFENQGETASVVEAKLNYGIRTSEEFESITETSQTIKASVQAQMTGLRGAQSLAQGDPDNSASADVEGSMGFAHIYA